MLVTPAKQQLLVTYFNSGLRSTYKKGELIIRPQESPEYIYYIESGYVKAYSITKYGDENLHVIRHDGEIFPLIWTFTEEHRDVAYEAMDNVVIWRQPKNAYIEFLDTHPEAAAAVLGLAMNSYRIFAEHVNTLEYRTVRERAVSFLLACSRRFGESQTDGSIKIIAPLRQQDIASSINASRETASRELSFLAKKGLIKVSDRNVIILDKAALQKML
jgi:CRP-like cAMP-binding protein